MKPNVNTMYMIWIAKTQGWVHYHSAYADDCDTFKLCGAYGTYNIFSHPSCLCLCKFEPKHLDDWNRLDWTGSCVRKHPLNCTWDEFIMYSNCVKLPDIQFSWLNEIISLDKCKVFCLINCSCMVHTNLEIHNKGSGWLLCIEKLVDMRQLSQSSQDINIRMSASEIGTI